MKIGIISSFNSACGVAEYTRNLVDGLISEGVDIKIVANYPKDKLAEDPSYVTRLFHCPFMTKETTADVDGMYKYLKDRDVVHVQFETSLYHLNYFPNIISRLAQDGKKIVFTMHSSGMWPEFDLKLINFFITHENMWCSSKISVNSVIPMGIKFYDNIRVDPNLNQIGSFGLGRNNDDIVNDAISDMPYVKFVTSYGSSKWLQIDDLVKKIKESWVLSLLYPPVGACVSSSAVILAIGCDRPILISDTSWFNHVKDYPGLYICTNKDDIKENINYLLEPKNRSRILEDIELRRKIIESEKRDFVSFVKKHIIVYKSLLST